MSPFEKGLSRKKGCNTCLLQSQPHINEVQVRSGRVDTKVLLKVPKDELLLSFFSPPNNDLQTSLKHSTGSLVGGLEQGCLWLKVINIPMTR